jgi:hypothetical protein
MRLGGGVGRGRERGSMGKRVVIGGNIWVVCERADKMSVEVLDF